LTFNNWSCEQVDAYISASYVMRLRSYSIFSFTKASIYVIVASVALGCIIGVSISAITRAAYFRARRLHTPFPRQRVANARLPSCSDGLQLRQTSVSSRETATVTYAGDSDAHPTAGIYIDPLDISTKARLQAKFAALPRLDEIPPSSDLFLTFSNGHYSKLMLNAAALVSDLGYAIIVLAFDDAVTSVCEEYNLPYIRSDTAVDTSDFRQDRYATVRFKDRHVHIRIELFLAAGVGPAGNVPILVARTRLELAT
jgi:hypothetical protein